jgi:hypothetical protein
VVNLAKAKSAKSARKAKAKQQAEFAAVIVEPSQQEIEMTNGSTDLLSQLA